MKHKSQRVQFSSTFLNFVLGTESGGGRMKKETKERVGGGGKNLILVLQKSQPNQTKREMIHTN